MLDFAFRFIILCCKVEHNFAFNFTQFSFMPLYSTTVDISSWKHLIGTWLVGKLHDDGSVISKRKNDISQCLENPAQWNLRKYYRKQAQYSVSVSTYRPGRLKFCGANSNIVNARVRCGYKPYWIQTFYFHDNQFCSSLNVYRTLDSILLCHFTFQLTGLWVNVSLVLSLTLCLRIQVTEIKNSA